MMIADKMKLEIMASVPDAVVSVVPGPSDADSSYVDVRRGPYSLTIQCRPNGMVGVTSVHDDSVFGDGPHEVLGDSTSAISRILHLLESGERTTPVTSTSLPALREMLGHSQVEVANQLSISQAAVSKMERRSDMNVSTLMNLARVLGGELNISIEIGGRSIRINQFGQQKLGV